MMLDKDQITGWEGEPDAAGKKTPPKPVEPAKQPAEEPVVGVDTVAAAEVAAAEPVAPAVQSEFGEGRATGEHVTLTPEQAHARKRRSQWTALALFAFVILIFVITMTKIAANAAAGGS